MVVEIKSSKDIARAKKAIDNKQPDKKFNAYQFCGILKVDEDPIKIQQQLRDEWK